MPDVLGSGAALCGAAAGHKSASERLECAEEERCLRK